MSQHGNTVSSLKDTHSQSKSKPMSASEKQMAAVARKRITHKEIKVFVRNPLKEMMIKLCNDEGITQAEFIERLLENELKAQGILE